jgi:hypothetical protein
MQEVLLAHDRTFLHRLPVALGHAAMLATNAHLLTPMLSPPRSVELRARALLFFCRWEAA